jgi:acetate kinase
VPALGAKSPQRQINPSLVFNNMILVINAGSSSLKFKLFQVETIPSRWAGRHELSLRRDIREIVSGIVEKIGLSDSFSVFDDKKVLIDVKNHEQAMTLVFSFLEERGVKISEIKKVGHRVVHGGEEFVAPTLLNKKVVQAISKYNKLAPLHNPAALLCVCAAMKLLPSAKHVACFDTMFYKTVPDFAFRYALPEKIYKKFGARKYGFHGLSHQYIVARAAEKLKSPLSKINLITCHLGSGCSMTAIKGGKAMDTSMGFTPLEGLMMSTRTGDMDPSLALFLIKNGMSVDAVDSLFNKESGWFGVAGFKDLRDILICAGYKVPNYKVGRKFSDKQKAACALALKMFVYRVKKYIGAYAAILGRVDAIVFTAGVGERNADIRKMIISGLPIKTKILVVPTDEEKQIATLI